MIEVAKHSAYLAKCYISKGRVMSREEGLSERVLDTPAYHVNIYCA